MYSFSTVRSPFPLCSPSMASSNGLQSPLLELGGPERAGDRLSFHRPRAQTADNLQFHNFHGSLIRFRPTPQTLGGADQITTALLPDVPRGQQCPDHAILMGLPEVKGVALYRSIMIEVRVCVCVCVCRCSVTVSPPCTVLYTLDIAL